MQKSMNLIKKVLLGDGLMGIVWLGLAAIKIIELTNPLKNIALVGILICVVISAGSMFVKCDKEDEMSKENMLKAESNTYRALRWIMFAALMLDFSNHDLSLNLNKLIPFAFGIILSIKSFSFIYYEKHGE